MHLWPSTRLRDSFKKDYLNKLQFNFRRMNSHKQQNPSDTTTTSTNLLNKHDDNDDDDHNNTGQENEADGDSCIFCKDVLLIFSLCFCCGACY